MTTHHPAAVCPSCGHAEVHSTLSGCLYTDTLRGVYCTCTATWAAPKTLADAARERDEAMARAAEAADADWVADAYHALETLAGRHWEDSGDGLGFTTDDVWDLLAERGVPAPREPRALGTIVREAVREGLIRRTGAYRPSRRRHCSPIPVYVGATK